MEPQIKSLLYIGSKREAILKSKGINEIRQILECTPQELVELLDKQISLTMAECTILSAKKLINNGKMENLDEVATEDNQNDQHTEEPKSSDETQPKLREISKEELKQILEDHKKWLETDGKEGERADLKNANLKKANLDAANLQKAKLRGANLQKANLSEANLQKTDLMETNLQKTDLKEANLHHAYLYEANLQKAHLDKANLQKAELDYANLQKAHLSEANLQKATLPIANLQQASLSEANLQKTDLFKANLQGAVLSRSNLQKADLREANMQKAYLIGANLQKADLSKADMQNTVLDGVKGLSEANLQYTNLEGATGLLGNEFAQADVTGTKLPDDIKEFKALETVKETSQNARKIFFAMLLGCVYSWLTIATTTDVRLLTNTASSPLPIIGTEIPIVGFYIAAPLVLICLYFYFHLYLDNLWKGLASLPAIFPDGKPLDQTAYPWLLNSIVNRHFRILKKRAELKELENLKVKIEKIFKKLKIEKEIHIRPLIFHLKEWITIFLAWWVVPITMIAFWLRYIPRHDWFGTIFHIGLIVISIAFAIIFYRLCALTLHGKEKIGFQLKGFWKDKSFYYGVTMVMVGLLFSLLSYGAIEGNRPILKWSEKEKKPVPEIKGIKVIIPWAFDKLSYVVFANFREKNVSEKPNNYLEIHEKDRLESVKGANLKGANLNNADMYKAFLVKADLRRANLQEVILSIANLQEANLGSANLQEADLVKANLQEANLESAKLQEADLASANLKKANFHNANLQKVRLVTANLQKANLWDANLQEAILASANLQKANFHNANLQKADLSDAKLQEAELVNANLQKADISSAKLQKADLQLANLQEANLKFANLQEANLGSANLQETKLENAKNLTIEQLSKVKTLYQAKLDPELTEQVKKCCPHLLEKPKEKPVKAN